MATGARGPGRGKAGSRAGAAFTDALPLASLGIDWKLSARSQRMAAGGDAQRTRCRPRTESAPTGAVCITCRRPPRGYACPPGTIPRHAPSRTSGASTAAAGGGWCEAEPPRRGWRFGCCIPPPHGWAPIVTRSLWTSARSSRVERHLPPGSCAQSRSRSASAPGRLATSAWCLKERSSRRREVSNVRQTEAAFWHVWKEGPAQDRTRPSEQPRRSPRFRGDGQASRTRASRWRGVEAHIACQPRRSGSAVARMRSTLRTRPPGRARQRSDG